LETESAQLDQEESAEEKKKKKPVQMTAYQRLMQVQNQKNSKGDLTQLKEWTS
jgi:hypothetical protein